MIVLFGSSKGGTGKTTMATNIAQLRVSAGHDVLLLDMDKQESSTAWLEFRADNDADLALPALVTKHRKNLKAGENTKSAAKLLLHELRDLAKRYDDIIIDVGGHDSLELRCALTIADKAYLPFQPSSVDLLTLEHLNDTLIEEAFISNEKLECYGFVNCAPSNPNETDAKETQEAIAEFENIKVSHCTIVERKAFKRAFSEGLGVAEMKDKKAATEIQALYKEIFNG